MPVRTRQSTVLFLGRHWHCILELEEDKWQKPNPKHMYSSCFRVFCIRRICMSISLTDLSDWNIAQPLQSYVTKDLVAAQFLGQENSKNTLVSWLRSSLLGFWIKVIVIFSYLTPWIQFSLPLFLPVLPILIHSFSFHHFSFKEAGHPEILSKHGLSS